MNLEEIKKQYPEIPLGKAENLTNKKFGKLTPLYRTLTQNRNNYWVCKCDCGNVIKAYSGNLKNGHIQSCGCYHKKIMKKIFKDITGLKFNNLTVISKSSFRNPKERVIYWDCLCDCGNKCIVSGVRLRNGHTKSCGCNLGIDMMGKRFGKLQVVSKNQEKGGGVGNVIYWNCKCDCGRTLVVAGSNLRRGQISCGCVKELNLAGQKFGKLTIISKSNIIDGKGSLWNCVCECGNKCVKRGRNIVRGYTSSCGCLQSIGEENIIQILNQNKIQYQAQKTFEKCINIRKLKFDFYVNNNYIIEYDGRQHFQYADSGWNSKENYESTHQRDLEKNKYCFENNIPIIRIPYDVEYTIDDLKLETTHFLLTPENEKEYYNKRRRNYE